MQTEELLALPISAIRGGWRVKEGLYLFIEVAPGVQHTILLPDPGVADAT